MAAGISLFAKGLSEKEREMTFCGYNNKMADGLTVFAGGIAVQTDKRAKDEGVSVPQIPAIELEEIGLMVGAIMNSPKREKLEGVLGLALFVQHLYRKLREMTLQNPAITSEEAFAKLADDMNALMFAMEDDYYANLRPHYSKPEAISRMIRFLEGRVG